MTDLSQSPAAAAPTSGPTRWTAASYVYALVVAAVLAYFLYGLTVQVSDSFVNLLEIQHETLWQAMRDQGIAHGYLRPLLWGQFKIVYSLSGGHYYLWFRTIQVVQVLVLILLCVGIMRPATRLDAALVPGALAVLVGSHTFAPAVREAFPINSFLTVMIGCAAAAAVSLQPRARWWTDAFVILLLVGAALSVESGLLIWVVCVAAWIVGGRGLSRIALALMTLLVLAYLLYRFGAAGAVGGPGLNERASGFGFHVLEPKELVARFGAHPAWFYLYNVVASCLTVLLAEPKAGVYGFTYQVTTGQLQVWTVVSVVSSAAATGTVGWYLWMRRSALRAWQLDRDLRVVLVFAALLAANAVVSYPYTKNIIMSPAGVLFAPAVFVAARAVLAGAAPRRHALAMALVLVLNAGWAFLTIGTHYNLRYTAREQRNTWARIDWWLELQEMKLDNPDAVALRNTLQRDAVFDHPTPPEPTGHWTQWFGIE
ncbi:MAG TPA: hypothetical protein VG818_04870 [Gemmatimonadaceae bacterium]|nr:hypothetical protein [Gemmatimonadaceae bacterium]